MGLSERRSESLQKAEERNKTNDRPLEVDGHFIVYWSLLRKRKRRDDIRKDGRLGDHIESRRRC